MRIASIKLILAALSLVAMSPTITHAAFDLIVDGGFEPPNPTATPNECQSGFVSELVGESFGGPNNNARKVVQIGGDSRRGNRVNHGIYESSVCEDLL